MSELLEVSIKKTENRGEIIMRIMDSHPDAHNADSMHGFPPADGEKPLHCAGFILALLLEGAGYYREQIYGFIKDYERASHLLEYGNLDEFDEDEEYDSCEIDIIRDEEIITSLLESSEIIEIDANDFWEKWDGEDYENDDLPYVKVKVVFKNEKWAEEFDKSEFDTAFSIHL